MIELKDIEWLGKLAKLQLDDDEKEALRTDLEEIVGFAGSVSEAADSDAYRGVVVEAEDLRADEVVSSFPQELILSNVSGGEQGYFPVRKRRHDVK